MFSPKRETIGCFDARQRRPQRQHHAGEQEGRAALDLRRVSWPEPWLPLSSSKRFCRLRVMPLSRRSFSTANTSCTIIGERPPLHRDAKYPRQRRIFGRGPARRRKLELTGCGEKSLATWRTRRRITSRSRAASLVIGNARRTRAQQRGPYVGAQRHRQARCTGRRQLDLGGSARPALASPTKSPLQPFGEAGVHPFQSLAGPGVLFVAGLRQCSLRVRWTTKQLAVACDGHATPPATRS